MMMMMMMMIFISRYPALYEGVDIQKFTQDLVAKLRKYVLSHFSSTHSSTTSLFIYLLIYWSYLQTRSLSRSSLREFRPSSPCYPQISPSSSTAPTTSKPIRGLGTSLLSLHCRYSHPFLLLLHSSCSHCFSLPIPLQCHAGSHRRHVGCWRVMYGPPIPTCSCEWPRYSLGPLSLATTSDE